jgi:hypothetical protein
VVGMGSRARMFSEFSRFLHYGARWTKRQAGSLPYSAFRSVERGLEVTVRKQCEALVLN